MIKLCKRFRKFVRFKSRKRADEKSRIHEKLSKYSLHFSGQERKEKRRMQIKKICNYGLHFSGRERKVKYKTLINKDNREVNTNMKRWDKKEEIIDPSPQSPKQPRTKSRKESKNEKDSPGEQMTTRVARSRPCRNTFGIEGQLLVNRHAEQSIHKISNGFKTINIASAVYSMELK